MQFDKTATNHWLPTFPSVAIRVLEMFADENVAVVQLAGEIKLDPVLTIKILHVANSPLYRSKTEIATVEHAISWLGKSEVAGLALSFKLASFASDNGKDTRYFNDFWRQSFIQGCAMSRIAESGGQIPQGEAYVCGLLMDFGRLLMLDGYPSGYAKIIDESQEQGIPLHQVETSRLETNHAEIGEELIGSMGLPERYGEVAKLHVLTPDELDAQTDHISFHMISAAVVSSAIGDFFCRNNQGASLANIESICRRHLKMSEKDIEWLLDSVRDDLHQKADLFSVNIEDMLPMEQLLGHANGQIEHQSQQEDQTNVSDGQDHLQKENHLLRQLVSNLEEKVCKDGMTGIYNRDYFIGRLNERVNCDRFVHDQFALVMIDIDNFKTINDVHGHLAGDFAISWTAKFIDTYFDNGLVARFGGDEFVILVDIECDEIIREKLNALCSEVEKQTPEATRREDPFTLSAGAVVCRLERPHPSLPAQIFKIADKAMYEAKRAGGNREKVVCFKESEKNRAAILPVDGTTVVAPNSADIT